jgi:5'-nucleotidase
MSLRILLSNDDGIDAPGLQVLADAMAPFGSVTVVAPDREKSGAGHSLTLHRPLRIQLRAPQRYAVDGTPTDCVTLALKEIMRENLPHIVVSGINHGPNLGDDITYSGTVSAALEGTILGIQSVAFSLAARKDEVPNFRPAAYFARKLVKYLIKKPLPADVLLNVNIPNVEGESIDSYEFTRMGKRHYEDQIPEGLDPRGKKYYWIGGDELDFDEMPGSDCDAIRHGKVSITPVRLDLTHDRYLEIFSREWKL